MKINDVEKLIGIPKANIRYYESSGLLNPKRNEDNRYRIYEDSDIERLMEIKSMRMIGISIKNIERYYNNEVPYLQLVEDQLHELESESDNLDHRIDVCKLILTEKLNPNQVSSSYETLFTQHESDEDSLVQKMLTDDLVAIKITRNRLNRCIAILLFIGYIVNIFESTLISRLIESGTDYPSTLSIALVVICIFCGIIMHLTSSLPVQGILYAIETISLATTILLIAEFLGTSQFMLTLYNMIWFWGAVILYVAIVYLMILSDKSIKVITFLGIPYTILVGIILTILLGEIPYILIGSLFIITLNISIQWGEYNTKPVIYNMYYMFVAAHYSMTPMHTLFWYSGRASSNVWR